MLIVLKFKFSVTTVTIPRYRLGPHKMAGLERFIEHHIHGTSEANKEKKKRLLEFTRTYGRNWGLGHREMMRAMILSGVDVSEEMVNDIYKQHLESKMKALYRPNSAPIRVFPTRNKPIEKTNPIRKMFHKPPKEQGYRARISKKLGVKL